LAKLCQYLFTLCQYLAKHSQPWLSLTTHKEGGLKTR